jgi:dynein heavy chain
MATPNRSHYSFNIRDIARVFGGLRSGDTTALWIHETQRVYSDRLISMDDECTFNTLLQSVVLQHFKRIWSHEDVVYAHLDGKYTSTDIESLGETYR